MGKLSYIDDENLTDSIVSTMLRTMTETVHIMAPFGAMRNNWIDLRELALFMNNYSWDWFHNTVLSLESPHIRNGKAQTQND